MDHNTQPSLQATYAEVDRVVTRYENDNDGDRARGDLIRIAGSMTPERQAILADICALSLQEKLLDEEIARLSARKGTLLQLHRQAARSARGRMRFTGRD